MEGVGDPPLEILSSKIGEPPMYPCFVTAFCDRRGGTGTTWFFFLNPVGKLDREVASSLGLRELASTHASDTKKPKTRIDKINTKIIRTSLEFLNNGNCLNRGKFGSRFSV